MEYPLIEDRHALWLRNLPDGYKDAAAKSEEEQKRFLERKVCMELLHGLDRIDVEHDSDSWLVVYRTASHVSEAKKAVRKSGSGCIASFVRVGALPRRKSELFIDSMYSADK